MEKYKLIRGNTGEEIWSQVKADLENISYPFIYGANILLDDHSVFMNIEIDPGGGIESGFQSTEFIAPVPIEITSFTSTLKEIPDFRFALHDQDFIDKLGKFFGMEDVKIGYPEFDKKTIVKTNDADRVKTIFADEQSRKLFETLSGYHLHIAHYEGENSHSNLELTIAREITNTEELQRIYNAFVNVLDALQYNVHPA